MSDLTVLHNSDVRLAEFELEDDQQRWYEFTTWLDKGYQPRVFYPNGPISVKPERSGLVREYPEKFQGYITKHVPKFNIMHPEYDPKTKDKLIAEFFARQKKRSDRDGGHEPTRSTSAAPGPGSTPNTKARASAFMRSGSKARSTTSGHRPRTNASLARTS
ncbi:MAG: hypothetical protein ACPGVU_03605 [Limisphaerales bacterium]